jgi:hypothetical protein
MIQSRFSNLRASLIRATDAFLVVEPLWMLLATAFVFLAYLLNIGDALPWVGIALACLPFALRLLHRRGSIRRTPFDIPLALLMTGAVIGWYTSPDRTISLGALQCMLVTSFLYYSWVQCENRVSLVKWLLIFTPLAFLIVLILFIFGFSGVARQPNLVIGGSGEHHGLAMYLAILGALFFGIGLFDWNFKRRVLAVVAFLSLLIVSVVMTSDALMRLVDSTSIESRLPVWEKTTALLADSPFSGLGLGGWAVAYWGTTIIGTEAVSGITHPHNGYLSLYADTGVLGLLALAIAVIVGAKLSLDIVTSPHSHPWYGFGVGVILACLVTLLVAFLESAPVGVPLVAANTYYYVISPIGWLLCALMVIAHRLVTEEAGPV